VLLLAVLGGVFAEGVDYPGEMLSEVIVVSPALPQVGPERELLKEYFADRYERGFDYAYLVPGMTRVVQAAGRLIRSADDRGVIVLICRRFLRPPYVTMLPADWTGGKPSGLRADDPAAAVREFFADDEPAC
jgi:Rad3-related DNA helicase